MHSIRVFPLCALKVERMNSLILIFEGRVKAKVYDKMIMVRIVGEIIMEYMVIHDETLNVLLE